MNLAVLSIQVDPKKIGFLKFILEGYDGFALLSTRDAQTGDVDIFYPPELKSDVYDLINSLSSLIKWNN